MALLVAAALVAWRNVRVGRGDKKGAWRVAVALFACGVASWALVASHVPTQWELYVLLNGLSWAGFQAAFVGLLYLAVEPFVRRHWPDALISWMRVVGGRFRDPLVTSHVLVGLSAGLAVALANAVALWATNDLQTPNSIDLSGARFLVGGLVSGVNISAFVATGVILVLVLLRSVVRRTWVADVLTVVLFSLPALSSPAYVTTAVLARVANVFILRRFGLIALVATVFASGSVQNHPLTATSWYAPLALTTPVILAALAAWSLYVIVTSRPGISSHAASAS